MVQKNRSPKPFVLIPIALLRDSTFNSLSPRAQILWIRLRGQYNPTDPDCRNLVTGDPQVRLPFSLTKKIKGFAPRQFHSAISELVDAGFLILSEKGGTAKGGAANAYSFRGVFKDFPNNHKEGQKK